MPARSCLECGAPIELKIARDFWRKKFCSRACHGRMRGRESASARVGYKQSENALAQRAETRRRNAIGHIRLQKAAPGLVYRQVMTDRGYEYEHRLVMEQILGRKLGRLELVHHRNGDPLDNRSSNLEIVSHKQHAARHRGGDRDTGKV